MKTKRFNFSLSRLLAHWSGRDANRTEKNYVEANLVGLFMHVVVLSFGFRLLLDRFAFWQELLLLLPLAFLVWIFWLLLFYFDSLLIRFLRAVGLMRELSDGRAQSIIIGFTITALACALVNGPPFFQIIGMIWIAAVASNLFAAIILAFTDVSSAE